MKKTILLLLGIMICFSCKQNKPSPKVELKISEPNGIEIIEKAENKIQYIENDTLVINWENNLENFCSKSSLFKKQIEPYENHHDETVIDTIKTLNFEKSNLKFYKAVNFEKLMSARIMNSEIKITESINVGMSKSQLEKIIKTKIESDILNIENLEGSVSFILTFYKDSLKVIEFEGYVD